VPVTPARLLVARPLARTIKWAVLAASVVPAAGIVWRFSDDLYGSPGDAALSLRLAALSLAIGLAFVLDDPTEDLTAPAPVSLLTRRAVRIGLTLPGATAAWLLLFHLANGAPYLTEPLPLGGLLLEVFAFAAVALAGAALGSRRLADGLGGPAGACTAVMFGAATAMFPWGQQLLALLPGTESHSRSQRWWWLILVVGVLGVVLASATPGTARPRLPRRWTGGAPEPRTSSNA
jgi:hypothetical protein